jgi:hypothetical protein
MTDDNAAISAAVPHPRAPCAAAAGAILPQAGRRWRNHLPYSSDNDTTRATASLPGLEIEIVHRRPQGDDLEALSINLQAMPSFEAFGRFLESANPFVFWAQAMQQAMEQAMQMAWLPWLGASRALMLPWHSAAGAALQPQSETAPKAD